jgi:predicted outer membrane repeat protein
MECSFLENSSNFGGGLFGRDYSSPHISDCVFSDNTGGLGGGIFLDYMCTPELNGCTFSGNTAWGGGALMCMNCCTPTLTDCEFSENISEQSGGAVELLGCDAVTLFDRCIFRDNVSAVDGGAIYSAGSNVGLRDCTLYGNSASRGGAIFSIDYSVVWGRRSTFSGNSASLGATLYSARFEASVDLERSIIAFSGPGAAVICELGCGSALTCCDVYGNEGGDWTGCLEGQLGVSGNISADPLFCDADGGDFTLHEDSPCVEDSNPDCGLIGAWPVGCGFPTAVRNTTWGRIKTAYLE